MLINSFIVVGRRRRRHLNSKLSSLVQAVRERRQLITGGNLNGIITNNGVPLPPSCCTSGTGVSGPGNTLGTSKCFLYIK